MLTSVSGSSIGGQSRRPPPPAPQGERLAVSAASSCGRTVRPSTTPAIATAMAFDVTTRKSFHLQNQGEGSVDENLCTNKPTSTASGPPRLVPRVPDAEREEGNTCLSRPSWGDWRTFRSKWRPLTYAGGRARTLLRHAVPLAQPAVPSAHAHRQAESCGASVYMFTSGMSARIESGSRS